jgi:hypothetical protein
MSTLFALALAASSAVTGPSLPSCSWDRPGVNPFMGNVVAAVDRYQDIPTEVRVKLKARMAKRQYDEIATISRDGVTGKHRYAPEITDMHFGQGTICRSVTRSKWPEKMVERGLVYCESGHCIIVPTVCRNVSRIQRLEDKRAAADSAEEKDKQASAGGGGGGGGSEAPTQTAAAQPVGELDFEAPAAGATSFDAVVQGRAVAGGTGLPASPPAGSSGAGPVALAPMSFAPFYGGGGGGGTIGNVPADPGPSGPLLPGSETAPQPVPGPAGPPGSHPPPTPTPEPAPPQPLPPIGTPLPPTSGPTIGAPVVAVPEPGTWALMALGLAALAARARRRH